MIWDTRHDTWRDNGRCWRSCGRKQVVSHDEHHCGKHKYMHQILEPIAVPSFPPIVIIDDPDVDPTQYARVMICLRARYEELSVHINRWLAATWQRTHPDEYHDRLDRIPSYAWALETLEQNDYDEDALCTRFDTTRITRTVQTSRIRKLWHSADSHHRTCGTTDTRSRSTANNDAA